MTSVSRIVDFIEFAGINKSAFYKKTGFSNGYLDKVKELGADKIEIIIEKYPDINVEWLITGKGKMLKHNQDVGALNEPKSLYVTAPKGRLNKRKKGKSLIDFYDTDFAAGDIEFYDDTAMITPAYQMDIPEFSGCTAFRTYNNSMEKIIHSGDILFGTNELGWRDGVEYGQIYGIVCQDRRKFLKYIRKSPDKEDTHFLLRSENEAEYDDFLFPKDKIKSVWLIHGWLKKRI